jgi:DNA helicase HerA-like ATPase
MAVRRIVKEGRKYGIGAMIVSQRPAEIDMTILSQCGTIIAMRLTNPTDRGHVSGAVSDNLEGFLGMSPILRTGEAIVIGEAVRLPIRAMVEPPPVGQRPDSADPSVAESWRSARVPTDFHDVVALWRLQRLRSTRWRDGISRKPTEHE